MLLLGNLIRACLKPTDSFGLLGSGRRMATADDTIHLDRRMAAADYTIHLDIWTDIA